jgi:hypothetical protein
MFDEIKKYKNNGHFFFKTGDNLKLISKSVPDLPGVFYIIRLSNGRIELVSTLIKSNEKIICLTCNNIIIDSEISQDTKQQ